MIVALIALVVTLFAFYAVAALSESAARLEQLRKDFKPCAPATFTCVVEK
jgi:hypothetical protein